MGVQNVTVRFVPLRIDHKKIATLENVTWTINSGDEPVIITEGHAGMTDGAVTCEADADTVTPEDPTTDGVGFVNKMLNKKYVTVDVPWMGKDYQVTMRFTTSTMASAAKSGMTTGKFKLMGGNIKVNG